MADTRTRDQRRRIMQAVRSKDTGPEMAVRSALHRAGLRYRLHRKDLPGRPDIVFPSRKIAVFVHGCFWHGHGCSKGRVPKTRIDFWQPKIARNRERDAQALRELELLGWKSITVWACELRKPDYLAELTLRIGAE